MATVDSPLRADQILKALSRGGVEYVVVGGLAVQVHGYIRSTRDVDIVPRPSRPNSGRLSQALTDLEAEELVRTALMARFNTREGPLDVVDFNEIAGAPSSFDALRDRALVVALDQVEIPVAGLDDLIRMKRAAGRAHDLTDIGALTRTDQELEREAREST